MATRRAFLFLAFVCLQAVFVRALPDWVPPELFDMVKDDKERCMSEHGTTQAMIDEVDKGTVTDNREITCYMYCLMDAFSLADENGDLDTDMMMGLLPDSLTERAETIMGKCLPQVGNDPCEKIYSLAKCVVTEASDLWFIV